MKSLLLLVSAGAVVLTGCIGPVALHQAVLGYDETVSRLETEMLLLNIARAHHNLPDHFTVTSAIAATFDYRTNVGFSADFPQEAPDVFHFSLGASAAENPTLSIVPVQGEEFTKRILGPMDEGKFEFLVFQGAPIDMVLRLMVDGIVVDDPTGKFDRFILNWPTNPEEYKEFRRRVMHLGWLNRNRNLFVGTLVFEETVRAKLPGPPAAGDVIQAMEKGYAWRSVGADNQYELTRPVRGRVAITNYDPGPLSNAERQRLNALAAADPLNYVLVDIRPGHPGGDFPLLGAFKLRSLNAILGFLAAGISRTPEFDVSPDPRTGEILRNPTRTLAIQETDTAPPEAVLRVRYAGKSYWVSNTVWDREAFTLLSKLFQMTVTEVTGAGIPVTISK